MAHGYDPFSARVVELVDTSGLKPAAHPKGSVRVRVPSRAPEAGFSPDPVSPDFTDPPGRTHGDAQQETQAWLSTAGVEPYNGNGAPVAKAANIKPQ